MTYDYYVLWPVKQASREGFMQGYGPYAQDEAMKIAERHVLMGQDDVQVIKAESKTIGKLVVTWE